MNKEKHERRWEIVGKKILRNGTDNFDVVNGRKPTTQRWDRR